jgi:hypothetical protein
LRKFRDFLSVFPFLLLVEQSLHVVESSLHVAKASLHVAESWPHVAEPSLHVAELSLFRQILENSAAYLGFGLAHGSVRRAQLWRNRRRNRGVVSGSVTVSRRLTAPCAAAEPRE